MRKQPTSERNLLPLVVCLLLTVMPAMGRGRIHCELDTVRIGEIMRGAAGNGGTLGQRCVYVAKQLEGTPVGISPENDSIGTLAVNVHSFDHLGFVNTVMAIAETSTRKQPGIPEYEAILEKYSRRKGVDSGFPSQFFYGSDWIVDNVYRGNLKEMTEYLTGGGVKVKTLDYVSHHPELYPALKDSVVMDKIKMMEMGYRSHRIPHLKKQSAGNKQLHELMDDGDIIMLQSNEIDRDIYDIGFVELKEGVPYLIHVSSETGKVTSDPYPMQRLFKIENQHFYGYRWLRPTD